MRSGEKRRRVEGEREREGWNYFSCLSGTPVVIWIHPVSGACLEFPATRRKWLKEPLVTSFRRYYASFALQRVPSPIYSSLFRVRSRWRVIIGGKRGRERRRSFRSINKGCFPILLCMPVQISFLYRLAISRHHWPKGVEFSTNLSDQSVDLYNSSGIIKVCDV